MAIYKCPLCQNEDPRYFGVRKGEVYCRRCIPFLGEAVDSTISKPFDFIDESFINIDYTLSDEQERISQEILKNYQEKSDTLVYAVCGAGKTELIFKVFDYALKRKQKIGFAIPRKDVVVELGKRLQKSFNNTKVVTLYGGHTDELEGDIVVLTTHQLYRYEKYFDLLILDEVDAFPYKGNFVLKSLFLRSIRGNYVVMSATPSDDDLENFKKEKKAVLTLFKRYHNHPLPVPKVKILFGILKYTFVIDCLKRFRKEEKKTIIFCSTIKGCESLFKIINLFIKKGNYVHSKRVERDKIINDLRDMKYDFLVSTSVLERGVTLRNLQVIVFNAHHDLYKKDVLIQISGRVGRSKDFPEGEVIYIASKITKDMEQSITTIEEYNKSM